MTVWYMSGAGNSFAALDARGFSDDLGELARRYCELLSADGFMALDKSERADIRLHFYNNDGSRAEMCGNGARCICRFAYDNGIVGEKMTVESDAGIFEGERISENIYRIRLEAPQKIVLDKNGTEDFVKIGVPHVLIRLDGLDFKRPFELLDRGRALRRELDANVDFYSVIDENTVKILTYERGVEDFTLACGTGSLAVAVALWKREIIKNNSVTVKNKGGELSVIIKAVGDNIEALYLEGGAEALSINEY